MTDKPRLLQDQFEIDRRRSMLSESHMLPLANYISQLRKSDFGDIPDFDPCDGGVKAEALFLFEKPGPKAFESGFISRNNNDQTAENTFKFMVETRLPREKQHIYCFRNIIFAEGYHNGKSSALVGRGFKTIGLTIKLVLCSLIV